MSRVITANFAGQTFVTTERLWKGDYGQVLAVQGLELPTYYEVHFASSKNGTPQVVIGTPIGIEIPNKFLMVAGYIYAWFFLHEEENDGETKYQIKIPVEDKGIPIDQETPEDKTAVQKAIEALNTETEEANQYKQDSEAWAIGTRNGEPVDVDDPAYENNSKYWADKSKEDAPVTSVNGEKGDVKLTLDDIPDGDTYVRATPEQLAQIGTNKDDIADVRAVAETALQPNDLIPYRTATAQDAIDNDQNTKINKNKDDIADIEDLIPNQATPQNQLADKDFVNSSINSSAAFFRGSFNTHSDLFAVPWQTSNPAAEHFVTNNDYAYVAADETHNNEAWRYTYVLQFGSQDNGWKPQFKVNETPLTAAQLAALNSGATAALINQISTNEENIEQLNTNKQNKITASGMLKGDGNGGISSAVAGTDYLEPSDLEPYRTAADQDEIDAAQDERIDDLEQSTTAITLGPAPIATFDASAADMPLKGLTVDIEPVQSGSGDPSPENVRPIAGWTGCNIYHSEADTTNPTVIPISWESAAGTVYGAALDVVNKKLTVDRAISDLGDLPMLVFDPDTHIARYPLPNRAFGEGVNLQSVCNAYDFYGYGSSVGLDRVLANAQYGFMRTLQTVKIRDDRFSTEEEFAAAMVGVKIVYYLATPIVYDLTDIPEILTLYGTNNIWADAGDVTVTYGAYLGAIKAHAERLGDSILSAIAPLEASYTASRAYAVGAFLFVGTKFFKVISAIAEGGTITPGTNAVQTTVAEQLIALAAG